jgi:cyclopropane-fatty-acyl-phospholipid synthase
MMSGPIDYVLAKVVARGNLQLTDARGVKRRFGDGRGRLSAVRLTDRWTEIKVAFDPWLAVGEAFMDGRLIVERGEIYDFLEILQTNAAKAPMPRWSWLTDLPRYMIRRIDQFNPGGRSRRNVAAHYDIEPEIYRLFLDSDQQYSCAYFTEPDADLESAQKAKKRHLAAKLLIEPGHKVLDIGCGWGGLARYMARVSGADVTGITLSTEQLSVAREAAKRSPVPDRLSFRLEDYRQTEGKFDRIVSVGMFEHIGVDHYRTFFSRVARLLDENGVAVVHSIGRFHGPYPTNPFIKKYIFPGGALPTLSEVLPAIEASGLKVCDVEILRLHYAETLRHWRNRFRERWDEVVNLKGERFCRMWEFYLAGSEASFRSEDLMVFQVQLAHTQTAVPLTREYIDIEEKRLAQCERFSSSRWREAKDALGGKARRA